MNKNQAGGTRRKLRIQAGGQVVLMVLLASALVLTLGLSAARQATVETNIDTDQELLKRAFNAAESGIEYYIKTGETGYANADYGGSAILETESLAGNDKTLSFNKKVNPEDVEFFWLVNHTDSGDIGDDYYSINHDNTVFICSDKPTSINLKVDYFYKEGSDYKVQRGDGAIPWVSTSGGSPNCSNSFSLQGKNSILLTVTPMGGDPIIVSVRGDENFPAQGEKISAIGSVGKVNNLVTIDHPYKLPRSFLLEAINSEDTVTN